MAKAWVLTYGLKACIHFLLANYAQTPLHEVVVEDPFVELMKDVVGDAGKDVSEGKVLPKRFKDFTQTFLIELLRLFVSLSVP